MLRELQKLVTDERSAKEKLETELQSAKDSLKALQLAGTYNAEYEKRVRDLVSFHYLEIPILLMLNSGTGAESHCYSIRSNLKKMDPLQFCLPVFLGIHRNPKQKDFFNSRKGFLR